MRSRRSHNSIAAAGRRSGSVILIVLWTLALAALITSAVQISSMRQATLGRESIERIQARWAARGGVEQTIAVMAAHTERPVPHDAFAMVRDMEAVAVDNLHGASYDIRHFRNGQAWFGPMDEHSKLNINSANVLLLMMLDNMWLDIADAIIHWMDPSHEAEGTFGLTRDYYLSLNPPYEPRMGRFQNIAEVELVAGVWPKYLRGEDWNLNSRLDPNENDGGLTFPPDRGDGVLDAGWSGYLTAYSVIGGATGTGLPRIFLPDAKIAEVIERLGVTERQAKALIRFGRNTENRLEQLLLRPITHVDNEGNLGEEPFNEEIGELSEVERRAVFDELTMHDLLDRPPGKMNINTVSQDLLERIFEVHELDRIVLEEIVYLRDSRLEGITSMFELAELPEMTDELLELLAGLFDVRSNVYLISSKGRSWATGLEVEIIAVVDRSTVPVKIIEYREQ